MGVSTDGFNDLSRSLESASTALSDSVVSEIVARHARVIAEQIKEQASIDPKVRSGNLRDSINVKKKGRGAQITAGGSGAK